jgi:hypothetical protein
MAELWMSTNLKVNLTAKRALIGNIFLKMGKKLNGQFPFLTDIYCGLSMASYPFYGDCRYIK